ncbi:hypothetical protein ABZ636_39385 [Streptomyces sp. NPDC007251]|uniref:hypothetical protein n=1 Tax=Streptomyces sp. NPDC007251 TaxID=3154483 RepID=UPI0034012C8E
MTGKGCTGLAFLASYWCPATAVRCCLLRFAVALGALPLGVIEQDDQVHIRMEEHRSTSISGWSRVPALVGRVRQWVNTADIAEAVTRAPFTHTVGATQVFTHDGRTTYVEKGRQSSEEWGVDDHGRFWSFRPLTCRATYDVSWIRGAEGDVVGGEPRGTFEGRHTSGFA